MLNHALALLKQKNLSGPQRLEALLQIVEHFVPEYFPVFAAILSDSQEDLDVRSAIALCLGKIGGDEAFKILKSAASDPNASVRDYVMQALGRTQHPDAAELLVAALKDKDNDVFASASEALGDLGDPAIPHLITVLTTGEEDARCVAAWQLGELGARPALPALIQTIQSETRVPVIALCIWALGEIGYGTPEVHQVLAQAKQNPEPDIRLRAETALKKVARHDN